MQPVRAGDLRQRITLTDVGEAKTLRGGFVSAPVVIAARIPAQVMPLSGIALVRAQQIDPRSQYSVVLRYRPAITARLSLTYHARGGDKTFEILNVNDTDEAHHDLTLLCREAA